MKLSRLLENLPMSSCAASIQGAAGRGALSSLDDLEITSIHFRAQEVQPGGLFVAVRGFSADGHDFIDEAIKNGAVALVTEKPVHADIPVYQVTDSRQALSALGAVYYGDPSKDMVIVGVTGTNGKTTTVAMIEAMLLQKGFKTGVIGTVDYHYLGRHFPNPNTTPESLTLQKILAEMRDQGVTHVIMEVSSHAISLSRVEHLYFDICVFTNLSQDHLDFHKDMETYFACKKRLFTDLLVNGPKRERARAVINLKDDYGKRLSEAIQVPVIYTGSVKNSTLWAEELSFTLSGTSGTLILDQDSFDFTSRAVGFHNLENILNAAGAALALGLSKETIRDGISSFQSVPGRLEPVTGPGPSVFVDYAHTPDGLEKVIDVLRPLAKKRLITVFGCGGDRDRKKRPLMGAIATALSDLSIVTSDNPRSEDPEEIIKEILAGVTDSALVSYSSETIRERFAERGYLVEPDRRAAIRLAHALSKSGDTILIAGKGHETYQIIGNKTLPFDDRVEAKSAIEAYYGAILSWDIQTILSATGGTLLHQGEIARFSGIGIDSRTLLKGEVFVAIPGDRFDGHAFIPDVVEKGAGCVVLNLENEAARKEMNRTGGRVTFIGVPDTVKALGDLAAHLRKRAAIKVIAITGSNGKTTTKEMVSSVLRTRYEVLATQGNFNNHVGLPLTLFNLRKNHRWAVLEMGMNHLGEIARLAEIASPNIGIVTNVGEAHLEGLGSIEGVARAKGELLERMTPYGLAILNMDDPQVRAMAKRTQAKVLGVGVYESADIRAREIVETPSGVLFTLVMPSGEEGRIHLKVPGKKMVSNALAAAAAGAAAGIDFSKIKEGLEGFFPVSGRMTLVSTKKGFTVIDDTYNANPNSMIHAIETLASLRKEGRGIAVLGDMFELGDDGPLLHEKIGAFCANAGLTKLFIAGKYAHAVKKGAASSGMRESEIMTGTKPEIIERLIPILSGTDWILVKGSRAMKMESVVGELKKWGDQTA